jgi:DNA-binding NtrC family response regulator
MTNNILMVAPSPLPQVERALKELNGSVFRADSCAAARLRLQERLYDLLVIDFSPFREEILEIKAVLADHPTLPALLLAEEAESEILLRAVSDWTTTYLLTRPFKPRELALSARKALDKKKLLTEVRFLRGEITELYGLTDIITRNKQMEAVIEVVKEIAPTNTTVLVCGETGTGKELIAKTIHFSSPRRSMPFVPINCGALPDTLLESELFGYERGAFTGAARRRIGKFEYASGGTLFLDEIESMSKAMQVKLLRVIEDKSLERLGDNVSVKVDVRLIAATNEDLEDRLEDGSFRKDLFYRLNVIRLKLPPLRERKEDIPLLAAHFLSKHRSKARQEVSGISRRAMEQLVAYGWPGNVRELENVIERAVLLERGTSIEGFILGLGAASNGHRLTLPSEEGKSLKAFKSEVLEHAEKEYLRRVLDRCQGRIGKAAQQAGISPRALYDKMKTYGLSKEHFKQSEEKP